MRTPSLTRAEFIDQVLTSCLPGQVAKRFRFDDGEVGAVYTLSGRLPAELAPPVILYVATFPPMVSPHVGHHDFGIDYYERPVASAEEAAAILAQFDQQQAAQFRASCRAV